VTDTVAPVASEAAHNDQLARRNALILALAQGCVGFVISLNINFGGYVGQVLSPDKANVTLPITTMLIGTFAATLPMAVIMQRLGRRPGFLIGAGFGIAGALLAIYAIEIGSFWLFCLATHFCGYYQSSANYYRFAAADTASPAFRPTAISWALAGGLLSAVLTPEILTRTRELWVPFAACYMAAAIAAVLGLIAVSQVKIPVPPAPTAGTRSGRPLVRIIRQPRFIAALAAGVVSYGIMNLVMTSTPLAMVACGFSPDDATHAIRWHVLAMYVPSFFTGQLIARFGREPMALIGMVLLMACGVVALMGISIMHFTGAMIALGLGWNFSYVSATALVTDCHTPEERGKTQAFNDLTVFGFVAGTSYLAGLLMSTVGWPGVSVSVFPIVAIAATLIVAMPFLGRAERRAT